MIKEIVCNAFMYAILIFIIYSIIELGLRNERLEKENKELKEYIKTKLKTFQSAIANDEKINDEIIKIEKRLTELSEKLEG